jgi:hypothetical protein
MSRLRLSVLLVIAALATALLPAAAPGASGASSERAARALAKRSFAVLRRDERAGDRVPGVTGSALLTRRVATVDGRRVWIGLDGPRLCVWLRGTTGGGATTCSSVARAVAPRSPLALLYRGGERLSAVVALPDGASGGSLETAGGKVVRQRIRHNALAVAAKPGARLTWSAPDGSEHQLRLRRPAN